MLFCCIDGRSPTRISLVLAVRGRDDVPRFLEGRCYSRETEVTRLLAQLEGWREYYRADIQVVVCAGVDGLPSDWIEALQGSFGVDWVVADRLDELMLAWQAIVPGQPWLRGTLMALAYSVSPPWWAPHEGYSRLYAWLASHLEDLDECNQDWSLRPSDDHDEVPV